MKRIAVFFFLILVFLSACKSGEKKTVLPEKAYDDFAKKIETQFAAGDTAFFVRTFDIDGLTDTIINEANMSPTVAITNRGIMIKAFTFSIRQIALLISKNANDGGYQLLHTRSDSTGHYALYRLFMKGSVNYHEYKLIEKEGKVAIGNMFVYFTGQTISETVVQNISSQMGNNVSLLKAVHNSYRNKDDNQHFINMLGFVQSGDIESAHAEYDLMSPEFQKSRSVQIMYLQVSQREEGNAYGEALENFRKLFPNDPCLSVLGIDYYFTQRNYLMALRSVDQLDSLVHDPFLSMYRSNCMNMLGRGDSAITYIKRDLPKIKGGPKDFCYRNLFLLEINSNKIDDAAAVLVEMRDSSGIKRPDLRTLSLINSDVYEHPSVNSWIDGGN